MDKQTLERRWDVLRQHYGIYVRVLEAIPENRLQEAIVPGMRSVAALVTHTSGGIVRDIAKGIASGAIEHGDKEADVAPALSSTKKALDYARECWQAADAAIDSVGDEELRAQVKTPWNMTFSGSTAFNLMSDEFLHHRGQLYVYARLAGGAPPFLWSFDKNAPDFAPRR